MRSHLWCKRRSEDSGNFSDGVHPIQTENDSTGDFHRWKFSLIILWKEGLSEFYPRPTTDGCRWEQLFSCVSAHALKILWFTISETQACSHQRRGQGIWSPVCDILPIYTDIYMAAWRRFGGRVHLMIKRDIGSAQDKDWCWNRLDALPAQHTQYTSRLRLIPLETVWLCLRMGELLFFRLSVCNSYSTHAPRP